jgi:hypothetical protein
MQRPERARGADVSLLTRISTKGKRKSQQEADLEEPMTMAGGEYRFGLSVPQTTSISSLPGTLT